MVSEQANTGFTSSTLNALYSGFDMGADNDEKASQDLFQAARRVQANKATLKVIASTAVTTVSVFGRNGNA